MQSKTRKVPTKRKAASPVADFNALPDAEKERQTAEFDRPFVADTFGPLPPAQRKLWRKAKRRGPGRPKKGEGVKTIALSVERGLLRRTDALAKRRKTTRAEIVAMGLEALLSQDASGAAKGYAAGAASDRSAYSTTDRRVARVGRPKAQSTGASSA
jgi:hypothetical protein